MIRPGEGGAREIAPRSAELGQKAADCKTATPIHAPVIDRSH